jgi:hypothetical protein
MKLLGWAAMEVLLAIFFFVIFIYFLSRHSKKKNEIRKISRILDAPKKRPPSLTTDPHFNRPATHPTTSRPAPTTQATFARERCGDERG